MASLWCVAAAASIVPLAPVIRNPNFRVSVTPARTYAVRSRSVCIRAARADGESFHNPFDFVYDWEFPYPPRRPNLFPEYPELAPILPEWLPQDMAPYDEDDEEEYYDDEFQ